MTGAGGDDDWSPNYKVPAGAGGTHSTCCLPPLYVVTMILPSKGVPKLFEDHLSSWTSLQDLLTTVLNSFDKLTVPGITKKKDHGPPLFLHDIAKRQFLHLCSVHLTPQYAGHPGLQMFCERLGKDETWPQVIKFSKEVLSRHPGLRHDAELNRTRYVEYLLHTMVDEHLLLEFMCAQLERDNGNSICLKSVSNYFSAIKTFICLNVDARAMASIDAHFKSIKSKLKALNE